MTTQPDQITRKSLNTHRLSNDRPEQPIIVRQTVEDSESSFERFKKFSDSDKFKLIYKERLDKLYNSFMEKKAGYTQFEAAAYTLLVTLFREYIKSRFKYSVVIDKSTETYLKNTRLFDRIPQDSCSRMILDPSSSGSLFKLGEKMDLFNAWLFGQVVEPEEIERH